MMYPLVRDLAADGAPLRVPVVVTCRVLGFSPKAYYQWVKHRVSDRDWDDAQLINAAVDVHRRDPVFGYRFIADELTDQGWRVSERRVWRLCPQQKLWATFSTKRGFTRTAGPPVH